MKWGFIFLLVAGIVSFAYMQLPQDADAQVVGNFDFYGYVKYPNGSFINATNITIQAVNYSAAMNGPPQTAATYAAVSDATGFFNVSNITPGLNYNIKIKKYIPNTNMVTWVGPTLPPFPDMLLADNTMGILNATFTLQRGGNINLSVVNGSGTPVNFTYEVVDKKLGFPIETPSSNQSDYVYSAIVNVPYDRNYSIQFHAYQSPPIEYTLNNLSSYSDSPNCFSNESCFYLANARVSNLFGPVTVYGYINTTDFGVWGNTNSNLSNLSIVAYMVFAGENVMSDAVMPADMGTFFGGQPDAVNASTPSGAWYNITLVGTTTGFTMFLVFYGHGNSTENPNAMNLYYAGYQSVTTTFGDAPKVMNITLSRLAGTPGTQTFGSGGGPGGPPSSVFTNLTTINLTSPDSSQPVGQAHMEAKLTYPMANDTSTTRQYRWFIETDQQTSTASIPFPSAATDLQLLVFSQNFAPLKKKISNNVLNANSTLNIQLYQMDIIDPDNGIGSGGLKTSVAMDFYTSSAACDVPEPAASCLLSTFGNASQFNPMKAMLGGGVSMRMTHTSGVAVHYVNVDMLASGPPDAAMDTTSDAATSDSGELVEMRKFGSSGPSVYDYVFVGFPYNDSTGGFNDSLGLNMSLQLFYDDDWNVIWNTTVNGTNATLLAGNYSDYAAHESEWQTLMNTNACVTTMSLFNASNPCYVNTTANIAWVRFPHFSGTGPSVTGTIISASAAASSSSPTTPSSGGGGGGSSSSPSTAVTSTSIWNTITANTAETMTIASSSIALTDITFTPANQLTNVKLSVKQTQSNPQSVEPQGTVFQYFDVIKTNIDDTDLNNAATMKFRIDLPWFTANGVDKNTVVLKRYTTQWDSLATTLTSEDASFAYYTATTPGFSSFAITAQPAVSAASCGDSVCDSKEDCSSCEIDCGACQRQQCPPGSAQCSGSDIQTCVNGNWQTTQPCPFGCSGGACLPEQPQQETQQATGGAAPDMTMLIIAVIVAIAAVAVVLTMRK